MPEPFVGGHKCLHAAPAIGVGKQRPTRHHVFQNMQQLRSNFKISLITGVVERNQDFI